MLKVTIFNQQPVKTSTPHPPICVLNIVLPDGIIPDPEYLDSPLRKYSFLNDSREYSIEITQSLVDVDIIHFFSMAESYHKSELPLVDVSNMIDEDWVLLADKLGISSTDVNAITFEYQDSVSKQALTMLQLWHRRANNKSSCEYIGYFIKFSFYSFVEYQTELEKVNINLHIRMLLSSLQSPLPYSRY